MNKALWVVAMFPMVSVAQDTSRLAFEVASVRPAAPAIHSGDDTRRTTYRQAGGPGTGQVTYTNVPLRQLVLNAYGLTRPYQLSAPAWMADQKFDIVAKLNPSSTQDDFRAMLRTLLAERFGMVVHHERRELPIYELVVAKGGPKLKEVEAAPALPPAPPALPDGGGVPRIAATKDRDGLLQLAPGRAGMAMMGLPGGASRYSARQESISVLVGVLENPLGRPVIDKTGLTGVYDFNLDFKSDERTSANVVTVGGGGTPPPPPDNPPDLGFPDLFTALQQELGLKLEDKKGPVDVLVVDRAQKVPTDN